MGGEARRFPRRHSSNIAAPGKQPRGGAEDRGDDAEVKWVGRTLFVLVYSASPKLFELTYDAAIRTWNLTAGFPVSAPRPSGSGTMVLEEDPQEWVKWPAPHERSRSIARENAPRRDRIFHLNRVVSYYQFVPLL